MNAQVEYEVEYVFGWVVQDGESFYWVKWKHYPISQATCEPEAHMANAANRVLFFHYCLQVIGATYFCYGNDGTWMALILPPNATIVPAFGSDSEDDSDDASDTSIEEEDNTNESDYVPETEDELEDH